VTVAAGPRWYRGLASSVLLGAFLVVPALAARPAVAAVALVLVAVAVGTVLRRQRAPRVRGLALLPPVVAVGILSLAVPPRPFEGLLIGVGAVLVLVWLADDPRRQPRGVVRAVPSLVIATLTVALAWGSSSLVPTGGVGVGVAAFLLLAVVALVGLLLVHPGLIGAEEAASS